MNWLARIKTVLARHFLLIEFCHRCGIRQPLVWHAKDGDWEEIRSGHSVLCPHCFDRLARQKGISLMWRPEIEFRREGDAA